MPRVGQQRATARCLVGRLSAGAGTQFPAAVDDSWAAFTWGHANAAEASIDPNRLAIGGDSAGGNLAAVIAMMVKRNGGPRIASQVLLILLPTWPRPSTHTSSMESGLNLTASVMAWFRDHYLSGPDDISDWRASPRARQQYCGPRRLYRRCRLRPAALTRAWPSRNFSSATTSRSRCAIFPDDALASASMTGFLKACRRGRRRCRRGAQEKAGPPRAGRDPSVSAHCAAGCDRPTSIARSTDGRDDRGFSPTIAMSISNSSARRHVADQALRPEE